MGVDAVFWLRSIQALKDPFADALGGIPPGSPNTEREKIKCEACLDSSTKSWMPSKSSLELSRDALAKLSVLSAR